MSKKLQRSTKNDHKCGKNKVMTNTSKTLEVLVDGGKLEQVDLLGYLGSRVRNLILIVEVS